MLTLWSKLKRLGLRTLGELTAQFMTNPSSLLFNVHRCESDNSRLILDPGRINILPFYIFKFIFICYVISIYHKNSLKIQRLLKHLKQLFFCYRTFSTL